MTLCSSLDALQSVPVPPDIIVLPPPSQQRVPLILTTVLELAKLLRHFRQNYGFKSALAFIFQAAALVSSILLNHLGALFTPPQGFTEGSSNLQIDVESAFDESYRCLLAIGTRFMIGRGVARMVHHTSRTAKTRLPVGTQRLLDVVKDVMWTSTDIQHISSSFPKWALQKKPHQRG